MSFDAGFRIDPPVDLTAIGEDEELARRIRAEIESDGPMTFARFMELALYDPEGGYYRAASVRPGRGGDFLTAPEAHPIFGHAISRQLTEVWDRLGRPDRFVVREHGAGTGALAEAILRGLESDRSPLRSALRYQPVEVEDRRLEALRERLDRAGFGSVTDIAAEAPASGVVLANEVLDALPVHRVGMRDGILSERFVGLANGELVDVWAEPSTPAISERLSSEGVTLVENQSAEICLGLDDWVLAAAAGLERGLLLVIDYGAPSAELYDPVRRPYGTLRAYLRHRVHDELYRHIGRQDLTAHVDLTALERAATRAGLSQVGATSQAEFLIGAGIEVLLRAVQADRGTTMADYVELRSALMRLIDPAAMGGFQVVAFGRAWPGDVELSGFAYRGPNTRSRIGG